MLSEIAVRLHYDIKFCVFLVEMLNIRIWNTVDYFTFAVHYKQHRLDCSVREEY